MKKLLTAMLCAAVLAAWTAPTFAQELTDTQKAQNKLLALRAARADAMRKLGERVKGLHITSKTTVKDFVTESDTIETAMNTFMLGLREKEGSAKFVADGTCELTMEVTLETVITHLKEIHNRHYKGDKFKAQDFTQMTQTNEVKVLSETGTGAPRAVAAFQSGEMVAPEAKVADDLPEGMSRKAAEYWIKNVPGQARLMAMRAARSDAQRKLAERIKGVYIASNTKVVDFITESDEINTAVKAILKGARETGIKYHNAEPIVEVEMAVTLETVYETVKSQFQAKYKDDKARIKDFEERIQHVEKTVVKETGTGVAAFDKAPAIVQAVNEGMIKWPAFIRAKGTAAVAADAANPAQAKLMAFRGAELDARRKLAEELNGLAISSKTTVKDFITASDEIRTAMMAFQQGARVIDESKKVMDDGTVEVEVEIDPAPLRDMVIHFKQKAE